MRPADEKIADVEKKAAALLALAALCTGSPSAIQKVVEADGHEVKEILMECQDQVEECAKAHALSFDKGLWDSNTYTLQNGCTVRGPIMSPGELELVSEELGKSKLSLRRIRNMAANQIMG